LSSNEVRFDGRVAVVTGAGRGLGRAYARLLAERGARVVVNDNGVEWDGSGGSPDPATDVTEEIRAAGGEAVPDIHDVSRADEAAAIVQTALDAWGHLDVLVHNAGIGLPRRPFEAISGDEVERVFATHVYGAFHVTKPAWTAMRAAGYGRIVLVSSSSALGATEMYEYPAAKAALMALTRSLAVDGAALGVKVNAIMPMAFTRPMESNPNKHIREWFRRHFDPALVAPVVAWLAHEDVPCSGETITAGAGRAARVVWAAVPGAQGLATVEDVRDRWGEIVDSERLVVTRDSREELALYSGEQAYTGGGYQR
jgi:NAD(P)-dependent dehydrogenase (short-subunit alcohol dehydrogenase family)